MAQQVTVARLLDPTQSAASPWQINAVVPTGKSWVIKSVYIENRRTDGQSITYELHLVPSGQTAGNGTRMIPNKVVAPGDFTTYEFNTFILNAGDALYLQGGSISGLWMHVHGAVLQ